MATGGSWRAIWPNMSENLTGKQLVALDALLAGKSVSGAAHAAGVSERTVRRWKTTPTFYAEQRRRVEELLDDTARRLSLVAANAPLVVASLMADAKTTGGVRLAAARLSLEENRRHYELQIFAARLDEVERRLAEL